jgi:hypothetical protein
MDVERFDLVVRSLFASRTRRTVLSLALGGGLSRPYLEDTKSKKRRKKKRKKRPSPCGACADNEECVGQRCVSLARICTVEDDSCTTGEPLLCGETDDPVEERASCELTLGGNPICARQRSVWCRPCTSHGDCEQQGWGPHGKCLSSCRIRCGEGERPSCAVPYGEPCRAPGEPCFADVDCCSQRCEAGLCRLAPPFCNGSDKVCQFSFECCSGSCGWPQAPFCAA